MFTFEEFRKEIDYRYYDKIVTSIFEDNDQIRFSVRFSGGDYIMYISKCLDLSEAVELFRIYARDCNAGKDPAQIFMEFAVRVMQKIDRLLNLAERIDAGDIERLLEVCSNEGRKRTETGNRKSDS